MDGTSRSFLLTATYDVIIMSTHRNDDNDGDSGGGCGIQTVHWRCIACEGRVGRKTWRAKNNGALKLALPFECCVWCEAKVVAIVAPDWFLVDMWNSLSPRFDGQLPRNPKQCLQQSSLTLRRFVGGCLLSIRLPPSRA
jgi:hypothetical protein